MKAYEITMMNHNSYHAMMTGSHEYHVDYTTIIAETDSIAVEKARLYYPNMIINEYPTEIMLTKPYEDQMTIADLLT